MKKKIAALLGAAIVTASAFSVENISASAWVDNGGGYHNYYALANLTVYSPTEFFPSGYSWVTDKETCWKDIYMEGGVAGTMKAYYNREYWTSDSAAEVTAGSMTGITYDGLVNCNGHTQWSLPGDNPIWALRSVGAVTRSVNCNGYQSVYYRGTIYWN